MMSQRSLSHAVLLCDVLEAAVSQPRGCCVSARGLCGFLGVNLGKLWSDLGGLLGGETS